MTDSRVRVVASGFSFLESPRWHDGRLWLSDLFTGLVHRLDPEGSVVDVCQLAGRPSGLGFVDGALLVVSMTDRRVLRWAGDALAVAADLSSLVDHPLNDLLVMPTGAFVGSFGFPLELSSPLASSGLWRVSRDGSVDLAATDLVFPNGMALSQDGTTLLVAETFASRITAFDVSARGSLSGRRTWARFDDAAAATVGDAIAGGGVLPDGIALDASGAVWVADAGGGGAMRVAPGGAVLDVVDLGELTAFAVTLGGPDLRTLYLCAGPPLGNGKTADRRDGVLLAVSVEVPGIDAGRR